jgi:tRNA(Ile)-lysidine synthase
VKKKFLDHINKFMKANKLWPANDSGKLIVAVSGGLDSMGLLSILRQNNPGYTLEVAHVHHGTRSQCDHELELVKNYCKKYQLKFHCLKLASANKKNFEHWARSKRYEFFHSLLAPHDCLYLGHHLDDAFEWSLLSQLRSSSPKGLLGIPLTRGAIRRPLLCVSRDQLVRFVHDSKLDYLEDESNLDMHYERNYIRHQVVPRIKDRHPRYLENFIARASSLAGSWGLLRGQEAEQTNCTTYKDWGVMLTNAKGNFSGDRELITKHVEKLCLKNRGEFREQINKIVSLSGHHIKGPYSLSGGVKCFRFGTSLLIVSKGQYNNWMQLDQNAALNLTSATQIPSVFLNHILPLSYGTSTLHEKVKYKGRLPLLTNYHLALQKLGVSICLSDKLQKVTS